MILQFFKCKKTLILIQVYTIGMVVSLCAQTHPTLDNTIICGYQGWFACYGDGSPVERWNHWCGGQYKSDTPKPAPGNEKFEIYPDISEYKPAELFQTGYAALGDGRAAKLFSSYPESTIALHFKWMQDAGIDGVALQRFLNETTDAVYKAHRDSVAVRMMRSAEKYDRIFYIMYDGVGNNMDNLINDWQNTIVGKLKLTSSPRYAYMNGKPVVCFWGFGLTSYSDTAPEALRAVNWFKANGCYVIGGTPTNWRTGTSDSKPGYQQVYAAYDMVSPWTPGRYKWDVEVDNYKNNFLVKDKAKLDSNNQAYQPVMFPGFAWSNWNGGAKNDYPRNQGKFMWRQFNNIKSLGIKYVYVAMFDEYDEGTAICKAAADYFDVPTNQYFQTMSTDSVYISSDFYLRLAGAASKVLKGSMPLSASIPIPNSVGPIFFRSSFEPLMDAQLTWVSKPDSLNNGFVNVTGVAGTGTPECKTTTGVAKSGTSAVQFSGKTGSTSPAAAYFKAIHVEIPVVSNTVLFYAFYPQSDLAKYAGIDLVTTDGTTLRSTAATDMSGISMKPSIARGTVNQWTTVKCIIGKWLTGKTIDRICIAFDHGGEAGNFQGYIDDIAIQTEPIPVSLNENGKQKDLNVPPEIAQVSYANGMLSIKGIEKEKIEKLTIYNALGNSIAVLSTVSWAQHIPLNPGIYFVSGINDNRLRWVKTLIVSR